MGGATVLATLGLPLGLLQEAKKDGDGLPGLPNEQMNTTWCVSRAAALLSQREHDPRQRVSLVGMVDHTSPVTSGRAERGSR